MYDGESQGMLRMSDSHVSEIMITKAGSRQNPVWMKKCPVHWSSDWRQAWRGGRRSELTKSCYDIKSSLV